MNPAFVSHEGNRDQNQDHNQDHALFGFREFKYSKQAFHALAAATCYYFTVLDVSYLSSKASVMLSEAKHLWPLLGVGVV